MTKRLTVSCRPWVVRPIVVLVLFSVARPAGAIPSPDLLINFSASAAQVLGLLSVMVGGFAYRAGARPDYRTERRRAWRWVFRGTLVCLALSVGLNVYQYTRALDRENRRLRLNLIRPSVEEGKRVGDVSLKTLSFSRQLTHPLGIATERLARWLEQGKPLNLIDIREPEEVEKGRIAGSWHIRYPDLRRRPDKLVKPGARTVLLCFSGNRSSELCDYFHRQGYDCRFLVGGYEKWIAEDRPLQMAEGRSPDQLRDLPDFPNKDTLLTTEQVTELVRNHRALFVDVRYPGDFERGHLPGAVNLPIRKLPTEELEARLRQLPKDRPVIAPCYDKRSCFYAQILGIRLSRLGYDYRGRYTLPHEFYLPGTDKEYVAQWRAAREGRSLLDWIAEPLQAALTRLQQATGHLVAAIALMVAGLRLAFFPWSLKAERDQLMQRRLAGRVRALKEQFREDEPRAGRAVLALYRRHGLTPGRNLTVSMVQIALFLVLFRVVQRTAAAVPQSFLWLDDLGRTDPTHVLPLAVALSLFGYLWATAASRTWWRLSLAAAFAVGIGVLAWHLSAAVNLYLLMGIAVIGLQSWLARRRFRAELAQHRFPEPAKQDPGIVPLSKAHRFAGCGQKAIRLGRMLAAGLPVPDGFVITDRLLRRRKDGFALTPAERRRMDRLWRKLGCERVAVRSSGINEDGARQSYAGMFETRLGVSRAELMDSLAEVQASFRSPRAKAYGGNAEEPAGVVVQKMVAAEYAGVLFTEHPATCGCMLVELVSGLGESLVSGAATPTAYRFGRLSGRLLEREKPPIDLGPLLALGRKVESLFGRPQDIEWAYARGRFYLLQARDITVSAADRDPFEAERRRLLAILSPYPATEPVLVQNELSELLPRPTPLSFSLMERLWAPGGSTDLACRILGVPYEVDEEAAPLLVTVYGALYVNRPEGRRRVGRGPGAAAAFRLSRGAEWIERDFRERFLPGFLRRMRLQEALDLDRLDDDDLIELARCWSDEFVCQTYVQAEVVNVAADFYWKTAARKLERRGLDPADYLQVTETTVVHRAMETLAGRRERRLEDFLACFGHRAPNDYELAQPRYREDPEQVERLARRSTGHGRTRAPELPPGKVLRLAVARARRFQVLKEEAKHDCLRQLANLRRLLCAIGRRYGLGDGVFYLTLDEVGRLKEADFAENARRLAAGRRRDLEEWRDLALPAVLDAPTLERLGLADVEEIGDAREELRGIRVSGEGDVIGPVQVVRDPRDIDTFRDGHILVARFTDPTWTPLFARARGLITEVGGWLSHAAIVAREYNLTAIVNVAGSTRQLRDGELVRLGRDGRVIKLTDRRNDPRLPARMPLTVIQGGRKVEAELRDLSRGGARIRTDRVLSPGDTVELALDLLDRPLPAQVVRTTPEGEYGVRFQQVLETLPAAERLQERAA